MDDIQLIDRIASGDSSAYRDLVERHKAYAFTVAYRILHNRENAEEAAQDAFIQAFTHLSSFNREAKFTTWFYRIVFNTALMVKRKQQEGSVDIETAQAIAIDSSTTEETKRHEQQFYIQQGLARLSAEDATVITLFYLKEHTLEEIAQITGISVSNAKVRLHRARQRLAFELKKLLQTEARNLL